MNASPSVIIFTNREDVTTDYIILSLTARKINFLRLNTEDMPSRFTASIQFLSGKYSLEVTLHLQQGDVVLRPPLGAYYRRPGWPSMTHAPMAPPLRAYCVEESASLLGAIYAIAPLKWLNHPDAIALAEVKPLQLLVASNLGFNIPRTLITNCSTMAANFVVHESPVVAKPLKRAAMVIAAKEHVAFTTRLDDQMIKNIDAVSLAPCIFQQEIKKKYDIRVTVVGEKVFVIAIYSQVFSETAVDWRRGSRIDIPQKSHQLPPRVEAACLAITRHFGLRFAAIDLILDAEDKYFFCELNPNGQWAWIEERASLPIADAIVDELTKEIPT